MRCGSNFAFWLGIPLREGARLSKMRAAIRSAASSCMTGMACEYVSREIPIDESPASPIQHWDAPQPGEPAWHAYASNRGTVFAGGSPAEPGTDALTRLDEHHGLVARAARGWWRRA